MAHPGFPTFAPHPMFCGFSCRVDQLWDTFSYVSPCKSAIVHKCLASLFVFQVRLRLSCVWFAKRLSHVLFRIVSRSKGPARLFSFSRACFGSAGAGFGTTWNTYSCVTRCKCAFGTTNHAGIGNLCSSAWVRKDKSNSVVPVCISVKKPVPAR